ncbi:MAG: helix-turn-helix domain containing protein [Spirochaetales bacterium]|nr:helix-turn-helix domain containing protein [Spirochaetales bacterium]
MTIKEIAELTARTPRTVRRWIERASQGSDTMSAKMSYANRFNEPADFDLEETEAILRSSTVPKMVVDSLVLSARGKAGKHPAGQVDYELIGKMIGEAVRAAVAPLYGVKIDPQLHGAVDVIPAPMKTGRAKLNQIVRQYAEAKLDGNHKAAWHVLYAELYHRCRVSIKVRAENAGVGKLDMIEELGLLDESYAILVEMMGE